MLIDHIVSVFPAVEAQFSARELTGFYHTPYNRLNTYHFGLGAWLRNTYCKPDDNLYQQFTKAGITHPDDMSQWIIRLFYIYLHESPNRS